MGRKLGRRKRPQDLYKFPIMVVDKQFLRLSCGHLDAMDRKGVDEFVAEKEASDTRESKAVELFDPGDQSCLAQPRCKVLPLQFPHSRAPLDQHVAKPFTNRILLSEHGLQKVAR